VIPDSEKVWKAALLSVAGPTHEPLVDFRKRNPASCIILLHSPDSATEPPDVLLGQQAVRRKDPVAEEADAPLTGNTTLFFGCSRNRKRIRKSLIALSVRK